jgi:NodT family efflux transporter outer membrane factor (OMF) lipoprotein
MKRIIFIIAFLLTSSCSLAPKFVTPEMRIPAGYKETGKWMPAHPDYTTCSYREWWRVYQDPVLNRLEDRVTVANQNLRAAVARYKEACALASVARADLFPTITGNASIQRINNSMNAPVVPSQQQYDDFVLGPSLYYEIDAWGRVRNAVAEAYDKAKASAADVATISLSLHAELASDYFALRGDDLAQRVLDDTVKAYKQAYDLTRKRHEGGVSPVGDVDLAKTQLESAKTLAADRRLKRAQLEHAIAVLIGEVPAEFNLPVASKKYKTISIAPVVSSALLEHRPDISAAILRVQAANAQIGVARAAYFPDITLLGGIGLESSVGYNFFTAPSLFWSLGPQAAMYLFDGGRVTAFVNLAKAQYFESVANYRQTTLNAFQQVEDSLVAIHRLNQEVKSEYLAAMSANRALQQAKYRYVGGVINYLDVVTTQNIALEADLASVDIDTQRQLAGVTLIKAIGGGWQAN